MESSDGCEDVVQPLVCLVLAREVDVLHPQHQVTRELARRPVVEKVDGALARALVPYTQALYSFAAEGVDVLLELNVPYVVFGVRAACIDNVLEV